ncbi:MAG: hypothetical protein ACI4PS_04835 [Rhodocyclaceae bacterium]
MLKKFHEISKKIFRILVENLQEVKNKNKNKNKNENENENEK